MTTPVAISNGSTSRSPTGTALNSNRSPLRKRQLTGAQNTYKRIGQHFDPSIGFVPRRNVQLWNAGANFSPRFGRGPIQQMFFEFEPSLATDLSGRWESYREHVRPDPLVDVEAGLEVTFDAGIGRGNAATAGDGRTDGETLTEIEVREAGQQTGLAGLRNLILPVRRRPAISFQPSLDPPLDIELPLVQTWLERQRQDGNANLRAPARRQSRRRGFPDAIPIGVDVLATGVDEAVVARARRVDGKYVAGAAVGKRTQNDADVIF